MQMFPLARTPMDDGSAEALTRHSRNLEKAIDDMTPWVENRSRIRRMRGRITPGEVVVILDGGESPTDPLYVDAKITRE
jgi:hypothetical protein